MTGGLTLSELLARDLSVQWYEGIAIVRGVVAALLEDHRGDLLALPELDQIELLADGSVVVTGGGPVNEPVRRLGQLLQATLGDTDVPVQLRLIVSQATAPMPLYASITEFDDALAYFERPDRSSQIKALVEKAAAIGPATAKGVGLTLNEIAPLPDLTPGIPRARRARLTRRRSMAIAVVLVAVLALSGGAALYLRQDRWRVGDRTVSGTTLEAADALGAAVMAGLSAVSERAGMGRLVSEKTAAAASAPSEPPAAARIKTRPSVRVVVPGPVLTPASAIPSRAMLVFDAADELASAGPVGAIAGTSGAEPETDSTIYTFAAADVSPPVDVRPMLPRQLPRNVNVQKLSQIELIVGRDGSVESAKLLGDRSDVQGGMFLSAAKSWRYRPATKDGVAVRYRKLILVCFE